MLNALKKLAPILTKQEVVIVRFDKNHDGCFGKMIIDNKVFVHTLEHPDLYIPAGHYLCKFVNSYKFGDEDNETADVYEITGVKDRSHILFHVGNTKKDTTGCICLGMRRGEIQGKAAVLDSRKAVNKFHKELKKDAFLLSLYDLTE